MRGYIALVLLMLSSTLFAESVEFKSKNFPGRGQEFKIAYKEFKKGNKFFNKGKGTYPKAIAHYKVAYKFNPKSALLNYRLGIALLEGLYDTSSLVYLRKAIALDPKIERHPSIKKLEREGYGVFDYQYLLARSLHLNREWDKAISAFTQYKQGLNKYDQDYFGPQIDKQIKECENGKILESDPARMRIQNLGKSINSSNPDYGLLLTNGDSTMIFTSRRKGEKGQEKNKIAKGDKQYFEKLYSSEAQGDAWTGSVALPAPLNRHKRHQATAGISNDGKRLYLYITKSRKKGGNIYVSRYKNDKWARPKKYNKVSSRYDETSINFSKDNQYMFFVSTRPNKSFGGRDIWYCTNKKEKKNGNVKWSRPKNLGENINTKYDEDYPFLHHDNKTLYFSSKGHNSMGGYDIFQADLVEKGVFARPKNLSAPVNTPKDDLGYILRKDERLAYMTSTRANGLGEKDIFLVKFLGKKKEVALDFETHDLFSNIEVGKQIEPEVEAPKDKIMVIEGMISSEKTLEPISAEILLIEPRTKRILAKMDNHNVTGKYQVTVNPDAKYKIKAKSIGYANGYKEIAVGSFKDSMERLVVNVALKPDAEEKPQNIIILDKLYFEYKSAVLMKESYPQLNRLARLMLENPAWEVEVGGHTDNIGSPNYNYKLSGDRAKAVVTYLFSKGVPLKRLWWKGYGADKPISNNSTERGRAKNRRVEFRIMKQ